MTDEQVTLTKAERAALFVAVDGVKCDYATVSDVYEAVERIVAERLTSYAARERPVIKLEGIPQSLRAAAMIDAVVLGAAWDTIQPSIIPPPPWSYLRRFLNALADATDVLIRPGLERGQ